MNVPLADIVIYKLRRRASLGWPMPTRWKTNSIASITVHYARQFTGTDILINAACPGLVATDFTGYQGRPAQEAAATAIRLATLPDGGPTGSLFNDDGVIPW